MQWVKLIRYWNDYRNDIHISEHHTRLGPLITPESHPDMKSADPNWRDVAVMTCYITQVDIIVSYS